jgi:hypothetical protein
MAYKGKFHPLNPGKYKGDATKIVYRSRWELVLMTRLDKSPNIIQWSSEEIVIPYRCPTDGRVHRYFVDFYVKKKSFPSGKIEEILIEVKPKSQTCPPKVQTKATKRYLTEVATWGKNSAKWEAATDYCMRRGWKFEIFTEDHLGINF